MSLLLRPSMLDDLGLVPALQWQAREASKRSALWVKVDAENVSEDLGEEYKTCIYRVVQEALHNIVQHAEGAKCESHGDAGAGPADAVDPGRWAGFNPREERGYGIARNGGARRKPGRQAEHRIGEGRGNGAARRAAVVAGVLTSAE